MLSEKMGNGKCTTRTTDSMNSNMKELGGETSCCYADSKVHKTTDSEFLQRLMMSVITGKTLSLIKHKKMKIYTLGRWMARKVSNKKNALIIITFCRMPQGTNRGIKTSTLQC